MRRILIALVALAFAAPAFAQDAAKKAKEVCAACHGEDGNGKKEFPDYPKLAGQYADYLYHALRGYKSGARKNAIMAGLAKPLSRPDIKNLAAYLGGLPGPLENAKR